MTLTFIRAYEEFSAYRRDDGTVTYLAHGGMEAWTAQWDQTFFQELWEEMGLELEEFRKFTEEVVDQAYWKSRYVRLCTDCNEIDTEGSHVDDDRFVCEHCIDGDYRWCDWCEKYAKIQDVTYINDDAVCEWCRERFAHWCDTCDVYYHEDDSNAHDHGSRCCESPAMTFSVANNGDGILLNDTRATVSLPAGVISTEGMLAIYTYLRNQGLWDAASLAYRQMDPQWQTKQGNFTKRLSRAVYKMDGSKLTPEVLSHIGNIAREHSTSIDHSIEVTRDLNMGPAEFAHEESCWWQSYHSSRCALKTNGGYGLRSFNEHDEVTGRAWVMPMKTENGRLVPTFESLTPDAFLVFNGYEALSGYVPARIVAHMAGMTYRKVALSLSPMYVNSDSGYLVAPEDIAAQYTDGSYSFTMEQHSNLHSHELATRKELAHA